MSKLSKTARAAMEAVERGQITRKVELTDAEKIRQIRLNLEAHLSVPPEFIRVLLGEYDVLYARVQQYELAAEQMNRVADVVVGEAIYGDLQGCGTAAGDSNPAAL
jgi:hypothetical protein